MATATIVGKDCPFCGKPGIVITLESIGDYNLWVGGTSMQIAMPYLTPTEREALMTGICDDCWHDTFYYEESNEVDN